MASSLFFLVCVYLVGYSTSIQPNKKSLKNISHSESEIKPIGNFYVMSSTVEFTKPVVYPSPKSNVTNNAQNIPKDEKTIITQKNSSQEIESGAVIRGILVFVGIGLVFIIYLGCKTYRQKKFPIIRKYGVRGRRSDVEMRPLPLDDDEEDETVFDVGTFNKP